MVDKDELSIIPVDGNLYGSTGAYDLVHLASGKTYSGSSGNLQSRWNYHFYRLREGNHHCQELQRLYDENPGGIAFRGFLSENRQTAYDKEQELIDRHTEEGRSLNLGKDARAPFRGRTRSPETLEKASAALKNRSFSPEHRARLSEASKGRAKSVEHIQHGAQARQRPLSINGVVYPSRSEAAKAIGMPIATLSKRVLNPGYPEWKDLSKFAVTA